MIEKLKWNDVAKEMPDEGSSVLLWVRDPKPFANPGWMTGYHVMMLYQPKPAWIIRLHGILARRRYETRTQAPTEKTPTSGHGIIQGTPNGRTPFKEGST